MDETEEVIARIQTKLNDIAASDPSESTPVNIALIKSLLDKYRPGKTWLKGSFSLIEYDIDYRGDKPIEKFLDKTLNKVLRLIQINQLDLAIEGTERLQKRMGIFEDRLDHIEDQH